MEKAYGEIIAADETKTNVNKRIYFVGTAVHGQQ
jgi:hypothetical protein